MPIIRTFPIVLMFLFGFLPAKAQAELRLETWNSYGQLAEQGAICASFSALMESQAVLNPDLGQLWQERRKFAGAVIRKAVMLELNRDSTEDEINTLIASYRDWVLSSLMIDGGEDAAALAGETGQPGPDEALGAQKIKNLVNSQCKSLFEQGDEMIRQQNPKLAYLLEDISSLPAPAQAPSTNAGPRRTQTSLPAPLVTAQTTNERTDTSAQTPEPKAKAEAEPEAEAPTDKAPGQQQKEVQLSIGGGNSFTLTLPGQKPSAKPTPLPVTTKRAPIAGPTSRPNRPAQSQPKAVPPVDAPPEDRPSSAKPAAEEKDQQETVQDTDQNRDQDQDRDNTENSPTDVATSTELIPMAPKQPQGAEADKYIGATAAAQTVAKPQSAADGTGPAAISNLLEQQANAQVNLATPLEGESAVPTSSKAGYFAQLGAFSRLENATAEKQRLEDKFTTLFSKLPLKISEVNDAGPRFYRIRTAALSQRQIKAVCDLLWPHRIACLVKPVKTR